jgi:hypothetical protein
MDQGVIVRFKVYYLCKTFVQAIRAMEVEDGRSLREFLKGYNMRN